MSVIDINAISFWNPIFDAYSVAGHASTPLLPIPICSLAVSPKLCNWIWNMHIDVGGMANGMWELRCTIQVTWYVYVICLCVTMHLFPSVSGGSSEIDLCLYRLFRKANHASTVHTFGFDGIRRGISHLELCIHGCDSCLCNFVNWIYWTESIERKRHVMCARYIRMVDTRQPSRIRSRDSAAGNDSEMCGQRSSYRGRAF